MKTYEFNSDEETALISLLCSAVDRKEKTIRDIEDESDPDSPLRKLYEYYCNDLKIYKSILGRFLPGSPLAKGGED